MVNRKHSEALTLLKCVARRRQRRFTYIHHANHTVSSLLRAVFPMWTNTRLYHLSVTLSHIYRATKNYTNTHERHRDMHGRVWCVRDDDTFQCLRVHIAHSFMTKWMMRSEQKDFQIKFQMKRKRMENASNFFFNPSWKSCSQMILMELLFSHWWSVQLSDSTAWKLEIKWRRAQIKKNERKVQPHQ